MKSITKLAFLFLAVVPVSSYAIIDYEIWVINNYNGHTRAHSYGKSPASESATIDRIDTHARIEHLSTTVATDADTGSRPYPTSSFTVLSTATNSATPWCEYCGHGFVHGLDASGDLETDYHWGGLPIHCGEYQPGLP